MVQNTVALGSCFGSFAFSEPALNLILADTKSTLYADLLNNRPKFILEIHVLA